MKKDQERLRMSKMKMKKLEERNKGTNDNKKQRNRSKLVPDAPVPKHSYLKRKDPSYRPSSGVRKPTAKSRIQKSGNFDHSTHSFVSNRHQEVVRNQDLDDVIVNNKASNFDSPKIVFENKTRAVKHPSIDNTPQIDQPQNEDDHTFETVSRPVVVRHTSSDGQENAFEIAKKVNSKVNKGVKELNEDIPKDIDSPLNTPKPRDSPQKVQKPEAIEIPVMTKIPKEPPREPKR